MMSDTIQLLDVVQVVRDDFHDGENPGRTGTVVEVLAPGVFEVEFSDEQGRTTAIQPLRAEQLMVVHRVGPRRGGKFELYQSSKGEWRWRLKAGNGEIIATSEGYTSKSSAKNGIESVKKHAPDAEVVEA
jgi:uncharacterized protein